MKQRSPNIARKGERKDTADKTRRLPVITRERVRKVISEALTPTFLVILSGATMLWYASRLSNEYTTEMPIGIRIDGQKYRIEAVVSGRGSAIITRKLLLKRKLRFTLDELSSRPSRETAGALTITPASLMRGINGKISDLTIIEVIEAPEFVPAPVAPEEEKAEATEKSDGEDPDAETPKEKRQRERRERRQAKEADRAEREAERDSEK